MSGAQCFRSISGTHSIGIRAWMHEGVATVARRRRKITAIYDHYTIFTTNPTLKSLKIMPHPFRRHALIRSFSSSAVNARSVIAPCTDQLELPAHCSVASALELLSSYFTASGVSEPIESSRYLISHAMRTGYSLSQFEAATRENISEDARKWLISAAAARIYDAPVQYIIGNWDFFGRQFACVRPVLIPRPETEELVERVLHWCRTASTSNGPQAASPPRRVRILDVGCGSGCIGISLLASAAEAANIDIEECVAIDMSADAVALSNRNADNLLLPSIRNKYSVSHVSWREFAQNSSNWGKFDLIVSNPPYITKEEAEVLQREVADFESPLALLGGTDGMVMIRDLLLLAPVLYRRDLGTTKALWLETGESHPELITSAMTNAQVETMTGGGSDNKLWDKLLNSSSDPLQNLPISKESIFERYVNRYVTSSATPIRDLSGRMRFFSVNIV